MGMKHKTYPKYKDSGVEWLGKVPQHWETPLLKTCLKERNESNKLGLVTDILSLCMYRGVIPYSEKGNSGNKAKEDLTAYKIAKEGDIVLNSMNVIVGSVGLSKYTGVVSPVYYMLYPRYENLSIKYYNYIFQNPSFQHNLSRLGSGILIKKSESSGKLNTIRMKIPMIKLNKEILPLPTPEEQVAIASFLDDKVGKVDEAIAQKEQLIELLNERKQIIIQNAVTKGLNPNAPMKDSGIEWIGEVPEHWEVSRSQWLFGQRKEKCEPADEFLTASQKYGVIPQSLFMEKEGRRVMVVELNPSILKKARKGDFVISMRSFQGGLEFCEYNGAISSAYVALFPLQSVSQNYFKYLFKSPRYIEALGNTSNLVRDGQALRYDNFSMVDLPIVPLYEQEQIAEFVTSQILKTERLVKESNGIIKKLKEYKATLINSAVTGKINVSQYGH